MSATFIKILGGSCSGFWGASFFSGLYPEWIKVYSILNAVIGIIFSFIGVFAGGYLGDKLEHKYPRVKGYLSAIGTVLTLPLIIICYLWQVSFFVSFLAVLTTNIFGEMWYGPTYTMINHMFPGKLQGTAFSILGICTNLAMCVGSLLMGILSD